MNKTETFYCHCGCFNGVALKAEKDGSETAVSLEFVSSKYYEKQNSIAEILWNRIKFAWNVLRGKEYCLFDIYLENDDVVKFKEFVEKM